MQCAACDLYVSGRFQTTLFSLLSFPGLYITFIKVRVPASATETLSTPLFFGFVGLFNILLLWPLFPILDALGLEPFVPPPDASVWRAVLTNALLGTCLSEMLWLQSMLLTSPLVATMGLSMTIPLALVVSVLLLQCSLLFYSLRSANGCTFRATSHGTVSASACNIGLVGRCFGNHLMLKPDATRILKAHFS